MIRRSILSSTLIALVALFVLGFSVRRAATTGTLSPAKFSVTLTFTFGKRQADGKCGPGRGICELKLGVTPFSTTRVSGTASPIDDQKLEYMFQSKLPDGDTTFTVDRDITVDPAIAQRLGFKSLTILSGEYRVAASKGSFGGVELNIRTTK